MSTIHQMFCTHCTHGSSAIERHEGDLAQRTLGYSVRAGSLDGEPLRQCYQQVEPLVYYHLPPDTPDAQKLELCDASAPRRLFFVPSAGGLQVCGQVCYRATDSEGRPAAYFAHLIVQSEEGKSRWSGAEVLKLWGAAGWVTRDADEISFQLQPLASIADLFNGTPAGVDDAVLLSFLRGLADSPGFTDPAGVIPQRWRAMEPAERRDWFLRVFSAFLKSVTTDRQPLVVVVEPSVAAVLFYGIFRMLPPGAMRDETGVSTFEADPDRAAAFLSATWPYDPQAAARPEACAWQRTTINTLVSSESTPPASAFAAAIAQRFVERGGQELDADLKTMATVRIGSQQDLDSLIEIDRAVDELFASGAFPAAQWRNWPAGVEYLRQKLGQRLSAATSLDDALKAVFGGSAHLTLIDLLTAKPAVPGTRRAVIQLLKHLPAEKILGLLKLPGVPADDKVTVLLRSIHRRGSLPPGCEFLWDEWAAAAEQPRRAGVVLMDRVIRNLPPKSMERFAAHVPPRATHGFLMNCLDRVRQKKMKTANLTAMVRAAGDEAVFKLMRAGGKDFLANYPRNEPALGEKLGGLLRTLANHPDDFKPRLDLILAGEHLLPEETCREAAAYWDKCYQAITEVGRLQSSEANLPSEKRQMLLITACRDMAMAADRAMRTETMDGEYPWNQKREFLLKIGQRVLGGTPLFLPGSWESDQLLQRVDAQLQNHRFPTDPLKKDVPDEKKEAAKHHAPPVRQLAPTSHWLAIGIFALLAAISVGAVWGVYLWYTSEAASTTPKRGPRDRERGRRKKQTSQADVKGTLLARGQQIRPEGTADLTFIHRPLTAAVAARIPQLVHEAVLRSTLTG